VTASPTRTRPLRHATRTADVRPALAPYWPITQAAIADIGHAAEPREYLYDPLASYLSRDRKGLRSGLLIAVTAALGGAPVDAATSAATLELLHASFLIHDDIEDGSRQRRGQAAMHVEHGVPIALNAGDALAALSMQKLWRNTALGAGLAAEIAREFAIAARHTVEGQAMELGWVRHNRTDITPEQYLKMILKKSSWYTTILPCRVGAMIATRGPLPPHGYLRLGTFLGAVFQIGDDITAHTNPTHHLGKEWADDLLEGKRTLMLIHLFNSVPDPAREELVAVFGRPRDQRTVAEVTWIYELMERYGSVEFARRIARRLVQCTWRQYAADFKGVRPSVHTDAIETVIDVLCARVA
jgi:geranylgeranyl diphosphate synthase type II